MVFVSRINAPVCMNPAGHTVHLYRCHGIVVIHNSCCCAVCPHMLSSQTALLIGSLNVALQPDGRMTSSSSQGLNMNKHQRSTNDCRILVALSVSHLHQSCKASLPSFFHNSVCTEASLCLSTHMKASVSQSCWETKKKDRCMYE